jgi:hypothetical protein
MSPFSNEELLLRREAALLNSPAAVLPWRPQDVLMPMWMTGFGEREPLGAAALPFGE